MWEVVSVKWCPADCKHIKLSGNVFYCDVKNIRIAYCYKCDAYNQDVCPKCGNPATGYCYTCGVHIRWQEVAMNVRILKYVTMVL